MAENEITTGTSTTTFSRRIVNRAQMITFIWRLVNTASAWDPAVDVPETAMF